MSHYHSDSRLLPTNRHPMYGVDPRKRQIMSRDQWQQLIDDMKITMPEGLVAQNEKLYVSPREAAEAFGLDKVATQVAERLIGMVIHDTRDMFGIAKLAKDSGLPDPVVSAILRRGRQMKFRESIRKAEELDEDLEKGKALPVGTQRVWNGRKVVKQAEGKWVDVKTGKPTAGPEGKKPGKPGQPSPRGKGHGKIDPDIKARHEGLKAKAKQHGVSISGELGEHHTHEHLDRAEAKLNDHVEKKKGEKEAAAKRDRPAPSTEQGKQQLANEVADHMDSLAGLAHRVDDDHKPMLDRLMKEGKKAQQSPTGQAVDWFAERVKSFTHLVTGKSGGGEDHGSPPGQPKDSSEHVKGVNDSSHSAADKLKHLAHEAVHRVTHALKHTAEEYPTAIKAIGKLAKRQTLTKEDRSAMISVGVTAASVALAGFSYGAAPAAATFGQKFLMHVATAAVHQYAASAFVGFSALKVGKKTAYILGLFGEHGKQAAGHAVEAAGHLVKSSDDDHLDDSGKPIGNKGAKEKPPPPGGADVAGDDDAEMTKFIKGVLAKLSELLDRDWSEDEVEQITAEDEEEVEKSIYFDTETGDLWPAAELAKAKTSRAYPVGWVSTYANGLKARKQTDGSWRMVTEEPDRQPNGGGRGREIRLEPAELEMELNHGKFSIISAGPSPTVEAEKDLDWKHPAIQKRYSKLIDDIQQLGFSYTVVHGKYGKPEQSIIVYHDGGHPEGEKSVMVHHAHPSEFASIRELGKKYGQESVIHVNQGIPELHYVTGPDAGKHVKTTAEAMVKPGEGKTWSKRTGEPDYYTRVRGPSHGTKKAKTTQFSLLFDWAEKRSMSEALHKAKPPPLLPTIDEFMVGEPDTLPNTLGLWNQMRPIAKSKGLYPQYIDGEISLSGDLTKAGIPAHLLPHQGAKTMQVSDTGAADLIKALT